ERRGCGRRGHEDRRGGRLACGRDPERGALPDGVLRRRVARDHRPRHPGGGRRLGGGRGVRRGARPRPHPGEQGDLLPQPARHRGHPAEGGARAQGGPPAHHRERQQRRSLGGVLLRGGEGNAAPGLRGPGHRYRRGDRLGRGAPARGAGSGRGTRARDDPGHGSPLRLRQPRMLGGLRLRHRHRPPRPQGRDRAPRLGARARSRPPTGSRRGRHRARPQRRRDSALRARRDGQVARHRARRFRKRLQPRGDRHRRRGHGRGGADPEGRPRGSDAARPVPVARPRRDRGSGPRDEIRCPRRRRPRYGRLLREVPAAPV
ncbi:MAG: Glucokinase, partial [uncultured Rubrobacteraceae bacterium]